MQISSNVTTQLSSLSKINPSKNKITPESPVESTLSNNIKTVSDIANKYDITNISPREMVNLSQDLYESGQITFKQHALLSFQPELNPSYNETIGKITGTTAQPDKPRNFLEEWKEKLEQQQKSGIPSSMIQETKTIVGILENLNILRVI